VRSFIPVPGEFLIMRLLVSETIPDNVIATGFQERFVLIAGFFLCASIPMWCLIGYYFRHRDWNTTSH
jgi:hypothetical protein